MTKTQIEEILAQFPGGAERVEASEDGKLATIVSRAFEGVADVDRQVRIWGFLRERVGEPEINSIDFVFTHAPGDERDAAA